MTAMLDASTKNAGAKRMQMWRNRCELLDEDRFSAPDEFLNEDGYTYFDMNREYVKEVSYVDKLF